MSESTEELRNMLLSFRVSELQMLLGYVGRNKSGRKTELQDRAMDLLRVRTHPIHNKIRELYKTIQSQTAPLNSVPQASSPVAPEQQAQATVMPQQPGTITRSASSVHPYTVDTRGITTRQAAAAALYSQQSMGQNMYFQPQPTYTGMTSNYPVHPDVRFKRLPFYDIIADLIKPSTLVPQKHQRMQEQTFYFHLTPQQATEIASSRDIRPGVKTDYIKQVQLRFCLLETTCEQEDCFPPQIMVKVNNKLCPLPNPIPTNKPGVEPKRPPRPVNITQMVKLSPTVANNITVSWSAFYDRGFVMTVALVHKLTSTDLLQRLQKKGAKHADHTRALIKEKLNDDDCEIATTSLRVSLMCPLGKMRMTTPCRPQSCAHLQCFDASLFLQMNERKPTWNCPVCDKPALYDNLVIDGYFQEVLSSSILPSECSEIQLLKDGSWGSHINEKKVKTEKLAPQSIPIDDSIEIIEDNVEIVSTNVAATSSTDKPNEAGKKREVVDLTLSDSDEDEPLAKRKPPPKPDSTIKIAESQSITSSTNPQRRTTTTPGPSSVSSSGYPASPGVINLDSPSPPRSPQTQAQPPQASSCMMAGSGQSAETNGAQQPQQDFGAVPSSANMPYLEAENEASSVTVNYTQGY